MTLVRWMWMPIVSEFNGMRAVINVASSYAAEYATAGVVRWVPMGLKLARAYAHANSALLPTTKIVDLTWAQAGIKVDPLRMPMGNDHGTARVITEHSLRIQETLPDYWRVNILVGTHKDLVEVPHPIPGRLAVYGWHNTNGVPTFPLNTRLFSESYYDYSQGVRLVKDEILIGDDLLPFRTVCESKELSGLVSNDGPFKIPDYASRE